MVPKLIGVALVLIAVLGIAACGGEEPAPTATDTPTATATAGAPETPTATATTTTSATATATATAPAGDGGDGASGNVISVELGENPYFFKPSAVTFDVGTTYTLSFDRPQEFHTFTVEGLGIDIFINAGEALEASITPSAVGDYALICVPHEEFGMTGSVTVQ